MNMIEAINSAMDVAMARDDRVVVFGEDVGYFGGVFRATAGRVAKTARALAAGDIIDDGVGFVRGNTARNVGTGCAFGGIG